MYGTDHGARTLAASRGDLPLCSGAIARRSRGVLAQACDDDDELRRQVEMLVSTDEHASSFLETPLLADVAQTPVRRGSLVGRQCGPYRILSLLGAGGMGEVYRANDCKLGRDVAIKTLPPEFIRDQERLARFRREARTLASLNHPNIAAIYGLEESAGIDYLVLELVEGDTLHGPLPVPEALDRACQVAEALEAAHEHGIIHRDLKPANLKVTPQGKVKVLDFGLAKPMRRSEGDLPQTSTATGGGTVPWHIVGTPEYSSPEQARGAEVDQRADVWAFGCLLFELLSGKRAFEGETASDTIAAVLQHELDWRALPPAAPARIHHLLRQCLQKDASRRLNNIRDARAILEEVQRRRNRWPLSAIVHRPRLAIPVAAFLLLLGFMGARTYGPNSRWPWWNSRGIHPREATVTPEPIPSVAVLPFANLSSDKEDEYFGGGLAEDIGDALAKLSGLRVVPPAGALRGKDVDVSEMGARLKVATILEGSVRRSGSRIRVTAQLIRAADRSHLWSERYDREMTDVFAIQDEISHAIVEKLRVRLAGYGPLIKRYTVYFYLTWLPSYLQQERHLNVHTSALLAGLPLFSAGLGSIFSGFTCARLMKAGLRIAAVRKFMAVCGFGFAAIMLLVSMHLLHALPAVAALAASSFAAELSGPVAWTTCMDLGGHFVGSLAGAMNTLGQLGGAAAPAAIGYILLWTHHDWSAAFYVSVVVDVCGMLCWMFMDPVTPLDGEHR